MKKRLGSALTYLLLIICAASALFPIYWTVLTSLRSKVTIFQQPPLLVGGDFTFDNYANVISDGQFLSSLTNTIVITVLATLICVLVGSFAAYALARRQRFTGRRPFEAWMIIVRAVPGIVLAVPLYQVVIQLGLYDQPVVLAVCYAAINLPFAVWLMVGFISGVPLELEESARMDGASQTRILAQIVFPLTRSGMAATTIDRKSVV
jgi:multiple sugar transport system permease protein